jgi:hypothetical protein
MCRRSSRLAFASVVIIVAAVGTTARAGGDYIPAGTDDTWFEVIADQDGSCRGLISSPLGVVRGIVQAEPNGRNSWATFPSLHGIVLAQIADLQGTAPHQGRLVGVLPVSAAFRPDSLRVGLVVGPVGFAIDVGTSEAKVSVSDFSIMRSSRLESSPALAFQDGDELFIYTWDGSSFRLLDRKTIPPGTSAHELENVLISGWWIPAGPGSPSCP